MATRLMQVLFSAVEKGDEKLTNMVGEDIRAAVENGKAEDNMNKLSYEHKGDGVVAITDKETGEVTMAERDPEGSEDEFNLWTPDEQIEGYAHPEGDGVTPGQQEGAPDEHVEEHVEGGSVADQAQPASVEEKAEGEGEVCPECGKNPCECEHKEGEKEFSTTNTAFQKVFSKQLLVEGLYSEVIESEETTTVGDLKFEKVPGEDAIVVTDKKTGHQVKVAMDEEKLNVVELESKSFGDGEEGTQAGEGVIGGEADHQESIGFWVIGLDADNHQLVESEEAAEDAAAEAAHRFEENGMIGVQTFENKEEASDYARQLLEHLGADPEEEAEVEEKEFSDGSVFYTRSFSTTHSNLMYRMFSEHVADAEACAADENKIKDALKEGEEVKVEGDVIIPVREDLGLIHDTVNDEYTKVEVEDGELAYEKIDEEEADKLKEEAFSDVYTNEAQTRFFSKNENFTSYMVRLFSEEADEEAIADAIESGEQVEHEKEIITPVDEKTAVIEDKENGEFTKAILDGEDEIEVNPISEEEAKELTKDLEVEEEAEEKNEEEKEFSVYSNEAETRFFSENETLTSYMERLFSEEVDEEEIAKAIESGEAIDCEKEIITPIDEKVAIIEDKENGEFTKAVLEGEDNDEIEVEPIAEEEAKELLNKEESHEAKEEEHDEEKKFSTLNKFFAEIAAPAPEESKTVQEVVLEPGQSVMIVDENGNPVEQPTEEEEAPASVEVIEDKALAAVQSIQEAAAAAEQAIQEAKAAPAENAEAPLQEAQFSQKNYSETNADTLLTWLKGNQIG